METMDTRRLLVATVMVLTLAAPAAAQEVFKGTLACALCHLNKPDAEECQDVLLVEQDGRTTEYYLINNPIHADSADECPSQSSATVTGTVKADSDGRLWLTVSKIEKG
jgi:hypothetical protein